MSDSAAASILIVEDEAIVALDLRYRLEAFGYAICGTASTGDEAIRVATLAHPDIVLMDIQLKGTMDGIEAARRIGQELEVPIVFVTAFTDEATLTRVKSTAPYGYIIKPYDEREIRIVLELAIAKFKYAMGLQRAKEAAEASDRAKTCFLSNISHELKTPLNVIMGCIDLASHDVAEDERREYLSLANRGARRLQTLIDTILDYTKVELGALAPMDQEFELGALLSCCWQPFAFEAHAKGLQPRLELDPALPAMVRGDPERLCTLVRNLLDNAIKFTETGFVCLSAQRVNQSDHEAQLRLAVTDSGRGIPAEQQKRLFEAFSQGDASRTRATGGLGLGLSLARALANLMGLRLEYSVPEQGGSAFCLYIPIAADAPPAFLPRPEANMLVALFGSMTVGGEFERWAKHLGIRMVPIETLAPSDGQPAAIMAAEADWLAASPERKATLTAHEACPLILMGGPYAERAFDDADGAIVCLPFPASMADLAKALGRASGQPEPGVVSVRPIGERPMGERTMGERAQSDKPLSSPRPALALAPRDYGPLVDKAQAEAGGLGLRQSLQELLILMHGQHRSDDATALERHVKELYDTYSDQGAVDCARLALAYAMDIRNGSGRGRI